MNTLKKSVALIVLSFFLILSGCSPAGEGGEDNYACTIKITCGDILENIDELDPSKLSLVPENGVLLDDYSVSFAEGESVFDILLTAVRENGIHMEYSTSPVFNTAYIEGIGNLYEFDAGELSGWTYCVNGAFPAYGCSGYVLEDGDTVEWLFTLDLGKDVGGDAAAGA